MPPWQTLRIVCLCVGLALVGVRAEQEIVQTTPKLEVLNEQIKRNAEDAQAYSNRGYTRVPCLDEKPRPRADLQKANSLKDDGPMHNRAGWAYFNMGDYATLCASSKPL
jgi:hypothetical protein